MERTMEAGNETGKSRVAIRNAAMVTRVLELRKAGHGISQIARELQLSRPTVRKYLTTAGEIATSFQEQIDAITQAALESIKAQILDRNSKGDGRLALDFAKCTVFAEKREPAYDFRADVRFQAVLALLPPAARGAMAPLPTITVEPPAAGTSIDAGAASDVPAPAPTKAPAVTARTHPSDCGCEDCRCPECHMRRNPFDAAGRILLSDRCLCVPRGSTSAQGASR